jgi:phosphatidate cytidylyltransferase
VSLALVRRILTAVVGVPVLVTLVVWAPPWLYAGTIAALAIGAQHELYAMFARVGVIADRLAGFVLGAVTVVAFVLAGTSRPWLVPLAVSLAVMACLTLGLGRPPGGPRDWTGAALTLLGVGYCAWLLAHAVWLRGLPRGDAFTLLLLGVTWSGETAAYLVGSLVGRRPLAPRISPAKTVEGASAQLVVSLAAAVAAAPLVPLGPAHAVGVGLLLGLTGLLGDLAESFLKRSAAAKDSGALLPGHGGLLDRLDSLLFSTPALYYYVSVLGLT